MGSEGDRAPPGLTCSLCGHSPATSVSFRIWGHISDILNIADKYAGIYESVYCRTCGVALYRDFQNTAMLRSWWNLLFFMNFVYITLNWRESRRLTALSAPVPTAQSAETPRSEPLPLGAPLLRRAGPWVTGGIVTVLVLLFVTGRITLLEAKPEGSPCGRLVEEDKLERLWCDDPNVEVEVIRILGPYATSDEACPPQTLFSILEKDDDVEHFVCWGYGDGSRWRDHEDD